MPSNIHVWTKSRSKDMLSSCINLSRRKRLPATPKICLQVFNIYSARKPRRKDLFSSFQQSFSEANRARMICFQTSSIHFWENKSRGKNVFISFQPPCFQEVSHDILCCLRPTFLEKLSHEKSALKLPHSTLGWSLARKLRDVLYVLGWLPCFVLRSECHVWCWRCEKMCQEPLLRPETLSPLKPLGCLR